LKKGICKAEGNTGTEIVGKPKSVVTDEGNEDGPRMRIPFDHSCPLRDLGIDCATANE
jgi:hypothetical protein